MLQLFIGNKNYSSWSMRPWVLMRELHIAFEEQVVRFDSFAPGSRFKQQLADLSPVGKVPVLVNRGMAVWDSLAITEYLAELHPQLEIWPQDAQLRVRARSVCADMHSGFSAMRTHCPMNIDADLREEGARQWRDSAELRADVDRLCALWQSLLDSHGHGNMLMGRFSAVDAFFAPVCMRLHTYQLPVPRPVQAYVERVHALSSVRAWVADAVTEKDFLPFQEPYRSHP